MRCLSGKGKILLVVLGTILFLWLLTSCLSDPGTFLNIDNQSNVAVSIYIRGVRHSEVPPGVTKEIGTMEIWPDPNPPWGAEDYKYLIEAKTEEGKVVYSKELTWQEIDEINWTIIIPPPEP
jgi:hypothetical protein